MGVFDYPIIRMKNNLVLTKEREVVAFYAVSGFSFSVIDIEKREKHKLLTERVLRKLKSFETFELALIPKDFRLHEKFGGLSETFSKESMLFGKDNCAKAYRVLINEMEIPHEYIWLIGVPLKRESGLHEIGEVIKEKVREGNQKLLTALGFQTEIEEDWYEKWETMERELFNLLSPLKTEKLTEEEMFYFQRTQFLRNIPHLQKEVLSNRFVENVTDTKIYSRVGMLNLQSEFGESFISVLPIGKSPVLLNGLNIAEFTQQFNFPVELRVKARFAEVDGVFGLKAKMNMSSAKTNTILREAHEVGNIPSDRVLNGSAALGDLSKKLSAKEPVIDYGMYLVVAASSREQLRERKKVVKNAFQNLQINVSGASFDNPYLFQMLLFGNQLSVNNRLWKHTTTPGGVAEMMLFSSMRLGTSSGFYLGRLDGNFGRWDSLSQAIHASRNLVFYTPLAANKEGQKGKITKSPANLIVGATGSGKSVLAQAILLQLSMTNAKTLYIDPKKELRTHYQSLLRDASWRQENPLLAEQIGRFSFVTLDNRKKSNYGVLDPIVILEETDAMATAISMISYLMGWGKEERKEEMETKRAIKQVVERRVNGEKVGFHQVLELLRKHEDEKVRDIGEYIFQLIDGTVLDLAFSDGKTEGLSYDDRVTVLEVANLNLPAAESEKMTDEERNSVALMSVLGKFCQRFGEQNEHEETVEFFDEAWILMKSKAGREVIKSMRRVGRSKNNFLFLISQSINDFGTLEDTTDFGTIFSFYENNESESVLQRLGLEANERNVEWLSNMNAGQCVMRDTFGRINRLSIHIFDKAWLQLFSPMKETKAGRLEKEFLKSA